MKNQFSIVGNLVANPPFEKPFITKTGKQFMKKLFRVEVDNTTLEFTAMMGGEVLDKALAEKKLPPWFLPLATAKPGDQVKVTFTINTSAKDEKLYTNLYCNSIEFSGAATAPSDPFSGPTAASTASAPTAAPIAANVDDLPF